MNIIRRLGIAPAQREQSCAVTNCPDLFELENGDFAVIGFEQTVKLTAKLPSDAGCGPGESIVVIPREVLIQARQHIPAE